MTNTQHIVLLGDSIFDNAAYVSGGPDVVAQLRDCLPDGARATLLAIDGAVVADVERQLARVPPDATLLVLSAGGNDALGEAHLLRQPTRTVAEAVAMLGEAQRRFAKRYSALLDRVAATGIPVAGCTIYDANFPPPEGPVITSALSLFNDAITRALFSRAMPLIDLRLVCNEPADYANPIEPSVHGGAKIAQTIAHAAAAGRLDRSSVWASPSAHTEEPAA
jgi:lysophospholipase L1-like esterase